MRGQTYDGDLREAFSDQSRAGRRIVSAVPATQILYEGLHVKLSRISILEQVQLSTLQTYIMSESCF